MNVYFTTIPLTIPNMSPPITTDNISLHSEIPSDVKDKLPFDSLQQLLLSDWDEISPEINNDVSIKTIVKKYLTNIATHETFIMLYNLLQSKISNPGDILYYLNPLKFPGYETIAIGEMYIDPTLDYSGFISACKVQRINHTIIRSFIQRLGPNSFQRKYEKIFVRPQKILTDRYSS